MDLQKGIKNYGSLYLACNDRKAFFTSSDQSRYTLWSCQNVCDALSYLLGNIYIRFGTKLYRQIVGIPMGTNWAPLIADLFLYLCQRIFEFSNIRISYEYSNAISGFEYSHNFLTCNIDMYQFKGGLKFKTKGRIVI